MDAVRRPQGWKFADVWQAVADRFPDAPAQLCGERVFTWREFDERSDGIAHCLSAAAGERQATVAQYLYNGPEYLETISACFNAALVPVNTNYRYTDDELLHVWSDAGVVAVVFHAPLPAPARACGPECPASGHGSTSTTGRNPARSGRSPTRRRQKVPDGCDRRGNGPATTCCCPTPVAPPARPKASCGSRTRSSASWRASTDGRRRPTATQSVAVGELLKPGPRILPAAPLMHGAALWFSLPYLSVSGSVVTVPSPRFDAVGVLDAAHAHRANALGIVGEVFARPLVDRLRSDPARWDLSALRVIFSSGVALQPATKADLVKLIPTATVVDSLGSSETGRVASARTAAGEDSGAGFRAGPGTRVVDEQWRDVVPGSGRQGRVALSGFLPLGYLNDPAKTRSPFVTIDGRRYALSGDIATVDTDGRILLVGRGSSCINTGGEKVYAEQVEEAIRQESAVADVVVVGVPDLRFGESIAAVVQVRTVWVARPDQASSSSTEPPSGRTTSSRWSAPAWLDTSCPGTSSWKRPSPMDRTARRTGRRS